MFIGNSYIPIHTNTSGGCSCTGSSECIGALGIIGIIVLVIGLLVGAVYLAYNLSEWQEDRSIYRGIIYAVCLTAVICGTLMIVFDPGTDEQQKVEQKTYTIYMEDKNNLGVLCEEFDIINIEGNLITVREK